MGHLLTALQFGGRLFSPSVSKDGEVSVASWWSIDSHQYESFFDFGSRKEIEATIEVLNKRMDNIDKNTRRDCEQLGRDISQYGEDTREYLARIKNGETLREAIVVAVIGLKTRLAVLDQEAEQSKKEAA